MVNPRKIILNYHTVVIWVLEDNKRARKFYERYGCVFDGIKKEMNIGKPLTVIRYVYTIQ